MALFNYFSPLIAIGSVGEGIRKLRDGTEVPVHGNDGIRKVCGCPRGKWAKCGQAWHLSFTWKGVPYRFSLNRHLGKDVDSKTMAEDQAERLRVAIKLGTFSKAFNDEAATHSAPDTFEIYARQWLRTTGLNLKVSSIRFYTHCS